MTQPEWTRLASVAPSALRDATLQLHWAAQYIAAAGQTFAEPRDDDSHRAMTWHAERREFVGEPFADGYGFRVALRPADLTLQLLDQTDQPLGSLPLAGHTRAEGFDWLAGGLANYMGAPPSIDRPDWDMPEHPVAGGARFSADIDTELGALSALYGTSARMLGHVVEAFDDASPVRCWPHHFDIATLITVERDDAGEGVKTVGVGMAPMGGGQDSWYWYVSPWPYPDSRSLPPLDGPGVWHTEEWTGALLTGAELVAATSDFRESVLRKFVDVGIAASFEALGL